MPLQFAVDLARRAGTVLLDGMQQRRVVELKSAFEAVTEIDRASEALIVAAITAAFPDHGIVAEEGSSTSARSAYTWLIDPVDGTNNYVHGMPFFAVSLALLKDNVPHIGVVFDPLRDELFSAERARGAWCNDRPIRVSTTPSLAASLVSTGFPYDYAVNPANNLQEFDRIQARTQGVRRAGAASLDLAYVAAGRLDAHWELRLKPWDTGAGCLLVEMAGGRLSERNGLPWTPWSSSLIASNGHIHDELTAALE